MGAEIIRSGLGNNPCEPGAEIKESRWVASLGHTRECLGVFEELRCKAGEF